MSKLEAKNIVKYFNHDGHKLQALAGINLSIADGEFVCLVGPSGCGKSTFLRIVAGLEIPDKGKILFDGKPIKNTDPDRIMVFQEGALFPWLKVSDNVEFGLKIAGIPKKVTSVISFHALGWLVGIVIGGLTNNEKSIFVISSIFFLIGFIISNKLPQAKIVKKIDASTKEVFLTNKFLFLSLLLRHIGAASVWTILPIMLVDILNAKFYEISFVYISNTLTAFLIMNVMAYKISLKNITKFKIGIGLTAFVFIGLSLINEWWMAIPFMALVGGTWAFIFIGGNFHLMENNPKSTATGIFSSTLSISSVIGPIFAGIFAFYFGYTTVIYFAIIVIIIAYIISLKINELN